MATTTHEPPKLDDPRRTRALGDNGGRTLVPATGDLRAVKYSPPPASTGIWVVLASITMTFLAFTSALVVRQGGASDWHHLTLPPILYLNTLLLIASSVALEFGRRDVRTFMAVKEHVANPSRWLNAALVLGTLFVAGQITAWMQLRAQGLYLATNPNSSFFYVLTVAHALHITGGLGGLTRVIRKRKDGTLRKSTLDATSHYWHFMDGLWIYLLWLLWARL
ncbi:MAG TPA: cytochrome c oxidase subunit 3 [Candidatus Solibacter sp.]|nr:cytochrome c oxidase subunit 3 [Candidatus Solibacter sp.]